MKEKRAADPDLANIIPLLIGVWRRFHKISGPADVLQTREFRGVVEGVKKLKEIWDGDKSLIGQDYFSQPDLLGSYLLYQWVIHYLEGISLINEVPIVPRRVLDICSGPCSYAFAALRHGATDVFAVDQNLSALTLGAEVCGRYGMPLNIRQWKHGKALPVEGKFDLIIVGHCLEELFPATDSNWQEKQQKFISSLLYRLSPEGYLLIVDNSYADANKRILQLRDLMVQQGIPVQAPCVWRGQCPALQTKNSPCYAQRAFSKPTLIKEIQRAADINLSSLKMSYIIFRNPQAEWPKLPEKPLYRIISPPVESYQGKRYYICGTDGKKNLGSHLTEHPVESRAFEYLRRGELISIENAMENQHAIDIVKETKIVVEAACGKPVREVGGEDESDY